MSGDKKDNIQYIKDFLLQFASEIRTTLNQFDDKINDLNAEIETFQARLNHLEGSLKSTPSKINKSISPILKKSKKKKSGNELQDALRTIES